MENPRSEIGGDSRIGPMIPPLGCIHTGYQYCTRGPAVPNSRRPIVPPSMGGSMLSRSCRERRLQP